MKLFAIAALIVLFTTQAGAVEIGVTNNGAHLKGYNSPVFLSLNVNTWDEGEWDSQLISIRFGGSYAVDRMRFEAFLGGYDDKQLRGPGGVRVHKELNTSGKGMYGVGFGYAATPQVTVIAEYASYAGYSFIGTNSHLYTIGDRDVFSVGVSIKLD